MIVTMFPEPREQAKAIGVYGFVASAGGSIGLLARRRPDPGDQLALDLPHQPADRDRRRLRALRLVEGRPGIGLSEGADVPGAALITGSLMIGTYSILGVTEHGWSFDPDARPQRRLGRRCSRPSSPARRGSRTR